MLIMNTPCSVPSRSEHAMTELLSEYVRRLTSYRHHPAWAGEKCELRGGLILIWLDEGGYSRRRDTMVGMSKDAQGDTQNVVARGYDAMRSYS